MLSFPLVGELFRDKLLVKGCSYPRHRRGTNRDRGILGLLPVLSCVPGEGLIIKPCFIPLRLSLKTWFCHVVWEPACGTHALFISHGLQLLLCIHQLSFALLCPTTSAGADCRCSSRQHRTKPRFSLGLPMQQRKSLEQRCQEDSWWAQCAWPGGGYLHYTQTSSYTHKTRKYQRFCLDPLESQISALQGSLRSL